MVNVGKYTTHGSCGLFALVRLEGFVNKLVYFTHLQDLNTNKDYNPFPTDRYNKYQQDILYSKYPFSHNHGSMENYPERKLICEIHQFSH